MSSPLYHDPLSTIPPEPCTIEIQRSRSPNSPRVDCTYLHIYHRNGRSIRKVLLGRIGGGSRIEVHVAPCSCAIDSSFFAFSDALTSPER